MTDTQFGPIEAAVRRSMDVFGDLALEIKKVYPVNIKMAEVHRKAAIQMREIADELENADLGKTVSAPMSDSFMGYEGVLRLLNEHLLGPIGELRKQSVDEAEVKRRAVTGLQAIAEAIEKDAVKLEENAKKSNYY